MASRVVAIALALASSVSAITTYERQVFKEDGARYALNKVNQLGVVGDQKSGGGHWEGSSNVTDTFYLPAGCYQIAAEEAVNGETFTLTLVETGDVIGPGETLDFSVGQAFCNLSTRDYGECFASRSRTLPAMTCRNYNTVLATECGFKTDDAAYTDIAQKCQAVPIMPISLTLVFRPAINMSDPNFEDQLKTELGKLLNIYPDAIVSITVTHHDGYDVVDVQIEAFGTDEYNAVMEILAADGSLDSLVDTVDALKGSTLVAAGAVAGKDQPIPSDVQKEIDDLETRIENGDDDISSETDDGSDDSGALVCDDGSAPQADGTCKDGSTPTKTNDETNSGKTSSSSDGGLSSGAIAGIAIGCILGAAILAGAGAAVMKRRRANAAKKPAAAAAAPATSMA